MSGVGIALVAAVMAVGLIGTIVPMLPGVALIWTAALVYGAVAGFGTVGIVAFAVITMLLAAGMAASYVLPHRAGQRGGAARSSLRWGLVGGVVGFFVIPVLGLPIGAVAGVLIGEYRRLGGWTPAWATTRGVLVAFGWAALAEFAAGVAMVGTWVAWVVAG